MWSRERECNSLYSPPCRFQLKSAVLQPFLNIKIMSKKSSKIIDENNDFLLVMQEKAKKDLENFANNSALLEGIKAYQKNLALITNTIDTKRMGELATSAMKHFSGVEDSIKTLSQNLQVAMPTSLGRMAEAIKATEALRLGGQIIPYPPSRVKSIERLDYTLTRFVQKAEQKLETKMDEFSRAIDKKLEDYKIKIVSEKNVYCGHCDYLLMKTKFIVYGEATMKCPGCKEIIHIPKELRYGELK